tara:strand:- start:1391 stop:1927 length:537 start_codon:yes stop_codon:yes gene_type:complete
MASFSKGDWVQVSNRIKWWKYWKQTNNMMPGNVCEVVDIQHSRSQQGVIFLRIKYKNREAWALDSYCIKIEKYDIIHDENLKRACDNLQEYEKACKEARDDILRYVFSEYEPEKKYEDIHANEDNDELYSDWEEVTTKECVPLPGRKQSIDTSQFIPTEWMTDEELDEYYSDLMGEND